MNRTTLLQNRRMESSYGPVERCVDRAEDIAGTRWRAHVVKAEADLIPGDDARCCARRRAGRTGRRPGPSDGRLNKRRPLHRGRTHRKGDRRGGGLLSTSDCQRRPHGAGKISLAVGLAQHAEIDRLAVAGLVDDDVGEARRQQDRKLRPALPGRSWPAPGRRARPA